VRQTCSTCREVKEAAGRSGPLFQAARQVSLWNQSRSRAASGSLPPAAVQGRVCSGRGRRKRTRSRFPLAGRWEESDLSASRSMAESPIHAWQIRESIGAGGVFGFELKWGPGSRSSEQFDRSSRREQDALRSTPASEHSDHGSLGWWKRVLRSWGEISNLR